MLADASVLMFLRLLLRIYRTVVSISFTVVDFLYHSESVLFIVLLRHRTVSGSDLMLFVSAAVVVFPLVALKHLSILIVPAVSFVSFAVFVDPSVLLVAVAL